MIKLPFIQHTATGLHITHEKIRWIELSRIRDHIWVKKIDSEPVGHNLESSLRNLIGRQDPTQPYVSVNVNSSTVLQKLINMPVFDEEDILDAWIDKQQSQLVEGMDLPGSFLVRHTFLNLNDEDGKCFIAAIKREERDKIKNILHSVGLKPIIITIGFLETAYGLILTPEFVDGQHTILRLFEDESFLGQYKDGFLDSFSRLDASQMSTKDILDELNLLFEYGKYIEKRHESGKVYLMLSDRFENLRSLKEIQANENLRFQLLSADEHFQFRGEKIASHFSIAAGLAMKQLYPDLDKLNFLEEEVPEKIKQQIEKQDTLHLACVAAVTLLTLFLFVKSVQWHAGYQLDEVQHTVGQMEDKIRAIENATEMLITEREQIKQVQRLIGNRSQLAPGLYKIGRLMPENIWLEEVIVQNLSASNSINVYGFSLTDPGVAKFMENLETDSGIENVVLRNAVRIHSDQIYKEEEFQPSTLIRFELQFDFMNR